MINKDTLKEIIYRGRLGLNVRYAGYAYESNIIEMTYDFIEFGDEHYLVTNYEKSIQSNCESLHVNMKALALYLDGNAKARVLYTKEEINKLVHKCLDIVENILLDMTILHLHGVRCIGTKVYGYNRLYSDDVNYKTMQVHINYKTIQVHIGVILKMANQPDNLEWLYKIQREHKNENKRHNNSNSR